ncbi:MAG: dUTP diphosphatase [Dehalococcoidia bacterium]|nr:dUTP diphosphatase [Dehalococcoidia bacterium]
MDGRGQPTEERMGEMGEASLKIKRLRPDAQLPQRATPGSSGFDIFAYIEDEGNVTLTQQPRLIGTGIAVEAPQGYDVQIRPRSGLSSRGVGVTFGTIDSDYRGELKITMYLLDPTASHHVRHGDRIAQMVIARLADLPVVEVEDIRETERGAGGHGSTGR